MESKKITILLIEDDPAEAGVIMQMLAQQRRNEYAVEHVQYLADALALLLSRTFDCILIDLAITDSQRLETALAVRQQAKLTPVAIITILDDEETALKSLEIDIQDYLVKGEFNSGMLIRSIRYAIQRKDIIERLRGSEERFASFMLHMPIAAWMKDLEGRYVYANAEAERILSKPLEALLGKSDSQILPEETARNFSENDRRVLSQGERLQTTEVLRQGDDIEHRFIVNKFVVNALDGRPRFVAGVALDITERKRAEDALRESAEKFSKIYDMVPVGITITSLADGRFTEINREGERLSGYRRDEVIGRTAQEVEIWNPPVEQARKIEEALKEGALRDREMTFHTKEGKLLQLSLSAVVIDIGGRQHLLSLVSDISRQKQAEKTIRDSEERFRALVTASSEVLYRMSPDWSIMLELYSPAFLTRTESPSSNWLQEYIHPDDQTRVIAAIQDAIRTKNIFELEHRVRRPDGSLGWTLSRAVPVMDASGELVEWFGAASDIDQRKLAEEALEEVNRQLADDLKAMKTLQELGMLFLHDINSEEILSEIVNAAVTVSNADFGNIQIRDSVTLSLRMAAQRGFPQWWLDYWNVVDEGKGACGMALESGGRVIVEDVEKGPIFAGTDALEVQLRAGVRAVQCTPLYGRDGTILGMFSTYYKTSRRPSDGELRFLDLLARQAADFIEQAQLRGQLEARAIELEEKNRELQTFNYSVAHDLRQPLNTISGYCQAIDMLCGDRLDDECKGYIKGARDSTMRMNQLIEALLNFSRMAHTELHSETLDLSKLVREVAEGLMVTNPDRRLTFRIAAEVRGDGDQKLLRLVLENLLGNAWKYTAHREEAIIEFGSAEIDGKTACFVRDNGSGFDMADAENLFQPFKRLSGAEEIRGFGIGLATVERIIRRHGGRIWAEGVPGKGATFWFTLLAEEKG